MNLFDKFVAFSLPFIPKFIVKYVSQKYIAGAHISDAIKTIKHLNSQGIMATVDILGEFINTPEEAHHNADQYIDLLKAIHHHKLDANISIKPTAMGLLLKENNDEEFCYSVMNRIVSEAKKYQIFVRIDMEDVPCTDLEFRLLERLRNNYDQIGIVIQAYLKRTYQDVEKLTDSKINCRICKGIYIEDPIHLIENANKDRTAINSHFLNHIESFFKTNSYCAIATHDEKVVQEAFNLIEKYSKKTTDYEFQMLLGVRETLRDHIISKGHKMRIYVPFGKDWYGYSTRRLKENPSMAGYVLKALIFGK